MAGGEDPEAVAATQVVEEEDEQGVQETQAVEEDGEATQTIEETIEEEEDEERVQATQAIEEEEDEEGVQETQAIEEDEDEGGDVQETQAVEEEEEKDDEGGVQATEDGGEEVQNDNGGVEDEEEILDLGDGDLDEAEELAFAEEEDPKGAEVSATQGDQEGEVEEQEPNPEDQEAKLREIDGEEEEDDDTELKERMSLKIREVVMGDISSLTVKKVLKILKKEFSRSKVKKHKPYLKQQIKAQVRQTTQAVDPKEEDEKDEEYVDDIDYRKDRRKRKANRKRRKTKRARAGPKKPKSAYIFFTLDENYNRELKEKYPGENVRDLMRRKGELWSKLDEDAKMAYKAMAEDDKYRYQAEMERWREENPEEAEQYEREKRAKNSGRGRKRHAEDEEEPYRRPNEIVPATYTEKIVNQIKKEKSRKRKTVDAQTLKMQAEEFCERMDDAYQLDIELMRAQEPAIHKLKMLPEVLSRLHKCQRRESRGLENEMRNALTDAGIFSCVRDWLEFGPEGQICNKKVRHELYRALSGCSLDEDDLNDTERDGKRGLGKVLMELWHSKLENKQGREIVGKMLQGLMRRISDRTADYRQLKVAQENQWRRIQQRRRLLNKSKQEMKSSSHYSKRIIAKRAVFDYAIRPASRVIDSTEDRDRPRTVTTLERKILRPKGNRRKALYTVSVSGKS